MIRLIAAIDQKLGIAKSGQTPWHLSADLKYFRSQTKSHGAKVLMGRKTLENIGTELADRQNFVLTTDKNYQRRGVQVVNNLDKFLKLQKNDLWIIGGEQLFAEAIDQAGELYLTRINSDYNSDQFFPNFENKFTLVKKSKNFIENEVNFCFEIWRRK